MFQRDFNTELKVGIFTVVGVATMLGIGFILEGNPFKSESQTFYTVLENVAGLGPRTQVRTSGVEVGEVSSIDILPKGAKVNFSVRSDVKVPKGSFLELRTRGLLGDVFLEIIRNENSSEVLKAGDMIPKTAESNDLSSLLQSMGSIAKDVQTVTKTLSAVLGNQEGQVTLSNIVKNIEQITLDTREFISTERKNAALAIQGFRDASEKLVAVLDRNDERIDVSLQNIASATEDFRVFAAEARKFVDGANRGKLDALMAAADDSLQSIKEASGKVNLIVAKVERGEGTIGQLLSKDDTINELNTTLKSVQEILKPAAALRIELDYKGEYRNAETENVSRIGNHFNVRLATRPDRYYMLGVTDSPSSKKVSEERTTILADGQRKDERVYEDKNRLRVNAQFAKRFADVGVRAGFFESTAGLAGDLYLFSDSLQASVEAFDFNGGSQTPATNDDGPGNVRVKAYANFFVTPNIYVTGGADNMVKQTKPIGFFGAGLRFNDDDLKSLVGAASLAR